MGKLSDMILNANFPDASDTKTGLVNTGAQTFGGVKTFNDGIKLGSGDDVLDEYNQAIGSVAIANASVTGSRYHVHVIGNRVFASVYCYGTMTATGSLVMTGIPFLPTRGRSGSATIKRNGTGILARWSIGAGGITIWAGTASTTWTSGDTFVLGYQNTDMIEFSWDGIA